MAFLERIGKGITDVGQSVAHQTKNLADVTRLNKLISEKEKRISQLFSKIGQSYYEKHKDDNTADESDKIAEIDILYGDIRKASFEILDTQDVIGGELEALKKDYEDINIKVSAAKTVSVKFSVTADEKASSNTMDVSVIKVGRSWYLDMESMGNIF